MPYNTGYKSIHLYMSDVTSRVVAKSGIPSDRYHLGKIILHSLQEDPDFVLQIDGAIDQSETSGSVLKRSIRCAVAFQKLGLKKGDVLVLMGPNHNDLCIPYYAACFLGIMIAGTDATLGVNELKDAFDALKPKIICCQSEKVEHTEKALELSGLDANIMTFNEGTRHKTLAELIKDTDDEDVKEFRPADFDPEETPLHLMSTSGTTGTPKAAILTHKSLCISLPHIWSTFNKFPYPTKMSLVVSPIQWLTVSFVKLFGPILRITRLQTSAAITPEHYAHLVNTYKPTFTVASPVFMNNMILYSKNCDFTSFEGILMGGSAVSQELIEKLKELTKTNAVNGLYGMSEVGGVAFQNDYPPPKGSLGCVRDVLEYRLVDQETREDINEAHKPGELWLRGPIVFKGYYNNPEITAETLTEDGWLKTGDIFYRDEYWHFYYVERLKLLLKYKNHQVSPIEVEAVIKKHPGVREVCVTGIPDEECGDLIVACVIPKQDCTLTAQEIKDIVKESLTDTKHLSGGVIFFKELPLTSSSKINRKKLQGLVLTMERQ